MERPTADNPEGPRSDEKGAPAAPAFHPEVESNVPPPADLVIIEKAGDGNRRSNRLLRKKILTPVVLAFIGLMLILAAIALYQSPSELPTPQYANVGIQSSFPIAYIRYSVRQVTPSIAKIDITAELPVGAKSPAAGRSPQLVVFVPEGVPFYDCPKSACQPSDIQEWTHLLIFRKDGIVFASSASVLVRASHFGETFNGVTASAAIPAIVYKGPGTPTAYVEYRIPSASSYDWSAFPTQFANGAFASWAEVVTDGDVTGRAAVGINHANQSKDDNKTFLAGALLGLAGGALLSAVQEALHAAD
jgi:hypothetical protein